MKLSYFKKEAKAILKASEAKPRLVTLCYVLLLFFGNGIAVLLNYLMEHTGGSANYLSDSVSAGAREMVFSMALGLILSIVQALLVMGYAIYSVKLCRDESAAVGDLFTCFRSGSLSLLTVLTDVWKGIMQLLWMYAFYLPVCVVVITAAEVIYGSDEVVALVQNAVNPVVLAFLGAALVILFVTSYRYRFYHFVLAEQVIRPGKEVAGPRKIIKSTVHLTRGHRWKLFCLDLSFLPWILLCCITCGIALIWVLPYMSCAYVKFYDALKADYLRRLQLWSDGRMHTMEEKHDGL